jgi:DNA-binding PadR family transcriptional regulator
VSRNKEPDDLDGLAKGGFVESRWLNVSETLYSITAKGRAALHEAEGND